MDNKFLKGFGIGALIIAVISLVVFFSLNSGQKAYGSITAPPSNFSYILASQSIDSPLFRFVIALSGNAVTKQVSLQAVQSSMSAIATTTPCAVQSPFNATSTLLSFSAVVTTSTSSAASLVIATSSSPNATTSPISYGSLAANAQGAFGVGNTSSSTGSLIVIPPLGWVTFGEASGTIATNGKIIYGGLCTGLFQGLTT